MVRCIPLILVLILYAVSYIVLGSILDKIFMFESSKNECKMIYTVMYTIAVLILTK